MIKNRKDFKLYRTADKIMAGIENRSFLQRLKFFLFPYKIDKFMYLLRVSEYLNNSSKTIVGKALFHFYYHRLCRLSLKLGFTIPLNVFGPGLLIPHYGTIVINPNAKVGRCCVLHTCVCIAGNQPKDIGDFAYFSKGVTVVGKVRIANNVTMSANSLINKDCLSENVLLGGLPAQKLKDREPWYIADGEFYKRKVEKVLELFKS